MLARLDWLSDRIPESHSARRRINVLQGHVRTAKATLAWFDRLIKTGGINESRRSRTRNALMHGGPLAGATVNTVLPLRSTWQTSRWDALSMHTSIARIQAWRSCADTTSCGECVAG